VRCTKDEFKPTDPHISKFGGGAATFHGMSMDRGELHGEDRTSTPPYGKGLHTELGFIRQGYRRERASETKKGGCQSAYINAAQ